MRSHEIRDVDGQSVVVIRMGSLIVLDVRGPRGGAPRVVRMDAEQAQALSDAIRSAKLG